MKKSESIVHISTALLEAQKTMGAAKKGATNPFFHSKYADLGSVMEACKEALNTNGITVLQPLGFTENGVFVETVLLHISGEWLSSELKLEVKEQHNPQAQGSAISYARRYGLQSMLFIPSEDDDAESTQVSNRQSAKEESTSFKRICAFCGTSGTFHKPGCPNQK